MLQLPMPLVDVEIGSYPFSWSHQPALEALVLGIWRGLEREEALLPVVLFIGGMHFEPSLAEGVLGNTATGASGSPSCSFGHVLPNQWVVNDGYLGDFGVEKIHTAASAFAAKPDILVYHDNLKGPFKAAVRTVAGQLTVPASNHRILRRGVEAIRRGG